MSSYDVEASFLHPQFTKHYVSHGIGKNFTLKHNDHLMGLQSRICYFHGHFLMFQVIATSYTLLSDFSETRWICTGFDCLGASLTSQWILIPIRLCNTANPWQQNPSLSFCTSQITLTCDLSWTVSQTFLVFLAWACQHAHISVTFNLQVWLL